MSELRTGGMCKLQHEVDRIHSVQAQKMWDRLHQTWLNIVRIVDSASQISGPGVAENTLALVCLDWPSSHREIAAEDWLYDTNIHTRDDRKDNLTYS
jgi:hypothetical protein